MKTYIRLAEIFLLYSIIWGWNREGFLLFSGILLMLALCRKVNAIVTGGKA